MLWAFCTGISTKETANRTRSFFWFAQEWEQVSYCVRCVSCVSLASWSPTACFKALELETWGGRSPRWDPLPAHPDAKGHWFGWFIYIETYLKMPTSGCNTPPDKIAQVAPKHEMALCLRCFIMFHTLSTLQVVADTMSLSYKQSRKEVDHGIDTFPAAARLSAKHCEKLLLLATSLAVKSYDSCWLMSKTVNNCWSATIKGNLGFLHITRIFTAICQGTFSNSPVNVCISANPPAVQDQGQLLKV